MLQHKYNKHRLSTGLGMFSLAALTLGLGACDPMTLANVDGKDLKLDTHVLATSNGREQADAWAKGRCGKKRKPVFLREFKPEKTPASAVLHYEYKCE